MALRDVYELPLAAQGALRAGVDFLNRLPEVEQSLTIAGQKVGDVLDEVLERVRPVEMELEELKGEAKDLRSELASARHDLNGLDERIDSLMRLAARLEGSIEQLFDKMPGLSSDNAKERATEIVREEMEDSNGIT